MKGITKQNYVTTLTQHKILGPKVEERQEKHGQIGQLFCVHIHIYLSNKKIIFNQLGSCP